MARNSHFGPIDPTGLIERIERNDPSQMRTPIDQTARTNRKRKRIPYEPKHQLGTPPKEIRPEYVKIVDHLLYVKRSLSPTEFEKRMGMHVEAFIQDHSSCRSIDTITQKVYEARKWDITLSDLQTIVSGILPGLTPSTLINDHYNLLKTASFYAGIGFPTICWNELRGIYNSTPSDVKKSAMARGEKKRYSERLFEPFKEFPPCPSKKKPNTRYPIIKMLLEAYNMENKEYYHVLATAGKYRLDLGITNTKKAIDKGLIFPKRMSFKKRY